MMQRIGREKSPGITEVVEIIQSSEENDNPTVRCITDFLYEQF